MALYKYWGRFAALTLRQAVWVGAPAATLLACGVYISRAFRKSRPSNVRPFYFAVVANLIAVTVMLVAAEALVRLSTEATSLGPSVAGTLLLPRSWERLSARNAEILRDSPDDLSYFVSDALLGWTVGPGRRSKDGLYISSREGIRSPRVDMSYADHSVSRRIVTVGDSFTFGLEGPFQDTWQFQLERTLGSEFDLLNFGVDGYGVDQAYLRYVRDARPWHPALTIFGFIQHDLRRSMTVYSFISFPEWGFPFAKPRFVLRGGKLELLNVPLPAPSELVAKGSVADLPFITEDPGYHSTEWDSHAFYASRMVRFLLSRFPRWPVENPALGVDPEAALNSAILRTFVRRAAADGSVPLVVYFPARSDFEGNDHVAKGMVVSVLRESGVKYIDLTACIKQVGEEDAFLKGRPHYSAVGNAAVARCLLPTIRQELERTGSASLAK
jgi:hypothetical protein